MIKNTHTALMAFAVMVATLAGFVQPAAAQSVTISTNVLGVSSDYDVGTTFTVRLAVTDNLTTATPSSAVVQLGYDNAVVSLDGVSGDPAAGLTDGWLGEVSSSAVGPEENAVGTVVEFDIPTFGNLSNTSAEPNIVDVTFTVLSASYPIVITADMDSEVGANALVDTALDPIAPVTVDDSATQALEPLNSDVGDWAVFD